LNGLKIIRNKVYDSCHNNKENDGKPLVSFIVLSFNNARYIEECLQSIENQSFKSIEIIIADDGSSDSSVQIIQSFIEQTPRPAMAILSSRNNGISKIYNLCLSYCSSAYIAHIASDDINFPERISKQYELLHNSDASMCIGGLTLIDENGKYIKTGSIARKFQALESVLSSGIVQVTSPTMMYRSDLVSIFGYLPENLANEDEALGFRAIAHGGIIVYDKPLVKYRKHLSSISGKQQIYNLKKYIEWLIDNIPFQIANKVHWASVLDIIKADNKSKSRVSELIDVLHRTRLDLVYVLRNNSNLTVFLIMLTTKTRRKILLNYLKNPARSFLYKIYKSINQFTIM